MQLWTDGRTDVQIFHWLGEHSQTTVINFNIDNNYILPFMDVCVHKKFDLTRLLGRPQPQMYPPVALNQYTELINIFIYASRPHENFEIDFTPKLSSNNM